MRFEILFVVIYKIFGVYYVVMGGGVVFSVGGMGK